MPRRAFELQLPAQDEALAPDPLEDDPGLMAAITAPSLILVGEHDMPDFHEGAEHLAREPRAHSAVIPAAGHLAPLETPEDFRALLLAFLS
ncbi:MAG: alpha/beta hydrolase [Solirubrobacteraceae bacterium]